eukprot:3862955-Prymnesium_polylepis.2
MSTLHVDVARHVQQMAARRPLRSQRQHRAVGHAHEPLWCGLHHVHVQMRDARMAPAAVLERCLQLRARLDDRRLRRRVGLRRPQPPCSRRHDRLRKQGSRLHEPGRRHRLGHIQQGLYRALVRVRERSLVRRGDLLRSVRSVRSIRADIRADIYASHARSERADEASMQLVHGRCKRATAALPGLERFGGAPDVGAHRAHLGPAEVGLVVVHAESEADRPVREGEARVTLQRRLKAAARLAVVEGPEEQQPAVKPALRLAHLGARVEREARYIQPFEEAHRRRPPAVDERCLRSLRPEAAKGGQVGLRIVLGDDAIHQKRVARGPQTANQ